MHYKQYRVQKISNTLKNLGRNEEAIKCYNKSIELDPNHSGAYNNKGSALGILGRNEEAIKCFSKSIELDPNDLNVYMNMGNTLMKLGKREEAIKCFHKLNISFHK